MLRAPGKSIDDMNGFDRIGDYTLASLQNHTTIGEAG